MKRFAKKETHKGGFRAVEIPTEQLEICSFFVPKAHCC